MKTPAELSRRWAQQWENADLREARLLNDPVWPVSLSIGRPTAAEVSEDWHGTAAHIRRWREVKVGNPRWDSVTFRATGAPITVPVAWDVFTSDDWILAANNQVVRGEYEILQRLLISTDFTFHSTLIRERSLWKDKPTAEVIQAATLAMLLTPRCAHGTPLRAISLAGIDTKFFERHRVLVTRLLDLRFDNEASRQGLESFLDAWREQDHWMLLADLGAPSCGILQFPHLRVRATDLAHASFRPRGILIVENESCLHLLPRNCPGIIALLGAGNNLGWLSGDWLVETPVAYWGDLDTWGLTLLARARQHIRHITALMMTREIFDIHITSAVPEKIVASVLVPAGLTEDEQLLYRYMLSLPCGRLEQEFLASSPVHECVRKWETDLACPPTQ